MKNRIYILLLFICFFFIVTSCNKDDDSTAIRGAEKIEIFIDGSTTPLVYSTNIIAKDYPLAPTSGFECLFKIDSEGSNSNAFVLNFGQTVTACPFAISTPTFENLNGNAISKLNIQGIDINYADTRNAITINYTVFGINSGDAIKIDFNGKYYDNIGAGNMHNIVGFIDITRD